MISLYPFSSLFFSTLFLSTITAISSNNWIMMWASMELNLLSMIPLMTQLGTNQETEAAMKYFFAQAIGSALFLTSIILTLSSPILILMPQEFSLMLFLLSLLIKAGAAPCHFWLPNVMSSLPWFMCLILTTWQKIIPIWILIHIPFSSSASSMMLIGMLGALVGGLGGINQTQLRPLLAYSSINHTGWIIACSAVSSNLSLTYFFIYILSLVPIMLMLSILMSKTVSQLGSFSNLNNTNKSWLMTMFLSLAGLPPLVGFMPKLITLITLTNNQLLFPSLILILGSLMSLYYYLSLFFNFNLSPSYSTALNSSNVTLSPVIVPLIFTLVLLPTIMSLL